MKLDVDRVRETKNSYRSLVENDFENGHLQGRNRDRRILLTLIVCTTHLICEEEGIVFTEGAEPERVRAWNFVSTVTKLWVGRATDREENLTSRLGQGAHPASHTMNTGVFSRGSESAHVYHNDQDTAIISLKATSFAKTVFFLTSGTRTTDDAQRVT